MLPNMAKSLPWKTIGERTVNNIMDSLDFVCLAFQAEEGKKRLDVIDCLIVRMTAVKMAYRQILNLRQISPKQYADFLGKLNSIGTQIGAWRNKQRKVAAGGRSNRNSL